MTDPITFQDTPRWVQDADTLLYAARGLAEHEVSQTLAEMGVKLSARDIDLARMSILAACPQVLRVLRDAGWLRADSEVDLATTGIPAMAAQARPVLEDWEQEVEGE
jgi:hypothetical protein